MVPLKLDKYQRLFQRVPTSDEREYRQKSNASGSVENGTELSLWAEEIGIHRSIERVSMLNMLKRTKAWIRTICWSFMQMSRYKIVVVIDKSSWLSFYFVN